MNNVKSERIKSDIRNALCEVFKKRGLTYVMFTDFYLSPDHGYLRVEIDSIVGSAEDMAVKLMEKPLHLEILKDLHKYLKISFPKIVFAVDSHKKRIERAEKLLENLPKGE